MDFEHLTTVCTDDSVVDRAKSFAFEHQENSKGPFYYSFLSAWALCSLLRDWHYQAFLPDSALPVSLVPSPMARLALLQPPLGEFGCLPLSCGTSTVVLSQGEKTRLGYVAVYFNSSSDRYAKIAGFVRTSDLSKEVALPPSAFYGIEGLIDYLFRIESGLDFVQKAVKAGQFSRGAFSQIPFSSIPVSWLVSQMERIYRTCPEWYWRGAAGDVMLQGLHPEATAATAGPQPRPVPYYLLSAEVKNYEILLQDLGECLMEGLSTLW